MAVAPVRRAPPRGTAAAQQRTHCGRLQPLTAPFCHHCPSQGGFLWCGKVGTGLVIARQRDGSWSAPSAIGTFGMSWGLQVGGQKRRARSDGPAAEPCTAHAALAPCSRTLLSRTPAHAQVGGEVTDLVMLLNSNAAVDAFTGR
jgi:hypothetical protein